MTRLRAAELVDALVEVVLEREHVETQADATAEDRTAAREASAWLRRRVIAAIAGREGG